MTTTRTRKFQGVSTETGKLIQGVSFLTYDPESKLAEPGKNVFLSDGYGHAHNVIPESVGDFTGVTDINGEELYEHDTFTNEVASFVVVFNRGCFCAAHVINGVILERETQIALRAVQGKVKTGNIYLNHKEK